MSDNKQYNPRMSRKMLDNYQYNSRMLDNEQYNPRMSRRISDNDSYYNDKMSDNKQYNPRMSRKMLDNDQYNSRMLDNEQYNPRMSRRISDNDSYYNDKMSVINPKTGRSIAVGSKTYKKLVVEGIIPNQLYSKPKNKTLRKPKIQKKNERERDDNEQRNELLAEQVAKNSLDRYGEYLQEKCETEEDIAREAERLLLQDYSSDDESIQ